MPYHYLEHKADLLIEAKGKGFPEALESAAQNILLDARIVAYLGGE